MIIFMWSGPRNLSTALMRSFENRNDTTVLDEPFYAHFLKKTGINHPGKEKILKSQKTNWSDIAEFCMGKLPGNEPIWYQKHMAQHNLNGFDISWIKNLKNCLLIRDPKYVIASYNKEFPIENARLLGYSQQKEIVEFLEKETSQIPPIIDATDLLSNPKEVLKKLCKALGIRFTPRMLHWPLGRRETDGVWAHYWYKSVERSTGFRPYNKKEIKLSKKLVPLYDKCMVSYSMLYEKRIRP